MVVKKPTYEELEQMVKELREEDRKRKQAEETLRESEKLHRFLTENSNDMITRLLPDSTYLYISPACRTLFGYTPEELLGTKAFDLIHPEDLTWGIPISPEAIRTGELRREQYRHLKKDGQYIWVETVGKVKKNEVTGNIEDIICVVRDITDRKRVEEALKVSEERFRIAAETSNDLIWEWNIVNGILEWFGAIDEKLGYFSSEFPRTIEAWENSIHPDDHDRVMAALDRHLKTKEPYYEEYCIKRKDGTFRFWTDQGKAVWDAEGNPLKMIGACTDITERKRAEEEILNSRIRLSDAIDIARIAYWEIDWETQEFILNDDFYAFYGTTVEAEGGYRIKIDDYLQRFVHPDDMSLKDQLWEQFMRSPRPEVVGQGEYRVIRRDGKTMHVFIRMRTLKNALGKITKIFGIKQDITQRKRAEAALQEREERFRKVFENIGSGIAIYEAITDGKDFIFKDINPTLTHIGRMKREDHLGRSLLKLYPGVKDMGLFDILQEVWRTGVPKRQPIFYYKDERIEFWLESYVCKLPTGELMAVYEDITARKRMEEEVLRQSTLLEGINKVLRDTLRLETDEEVACTCLTVAQEITGSTFGWIGEVNLSGRLDTIVMSDPGWDLCRMDGVHAQPAIRNMEIRGIWGRVLKDGKSLITNDPAIHPDRVGLPSGHPVLTAFLGVPLKYEDKTIGMISLANKPSGYTSFDQESIEALSIAVVEALRRKRAEEALRKSQLQQKALLDNIPDAAWLKDKESRFIAVNEACTRVAGFNAEDLVGKTDFEIWSKDKAELYRSEDQEVILTKQRKVIEQSFVSHKGKVTWLEKIKTPILNEKNEVIGTVGISRNITERKRAEEEREKLIVELRASLEKVKMLSGLLPICASCKKIRDDKGYWNQIDSYIRDHSEAEFTHGICPECMKKLYPNFKIV